MTPFFNHATGQARAVPMFPTDPVGAATNSSVGGGRVPACPRAGVGSRRRRTGVAPTLALAALVAAVWAVTT